MKIDFNGIELSQAQPYKVLQRSQSRDRSCFCLLKKNCTEKTCTFMKHYSSQVSWLGCSTGRFPLTQLGDPIHKNVTLVN